MLIKSWEPLLLMEQEGAAGGETLLGGEQPAVQEGAAGTQTNDPQGQNNPDAGKGQLPGWISGLEAELRNNPLITAHQKPTSFVKEALQWKEKADKAIVRPGEGASPDEVAAYQKAMGIPAKAEDYELDTKGFSDEFAKAQRELYHKSGVTAEQAKALWEATRKQVETGAETLRRVNVQEYLQRIDFTLLTSISEGQPLAVLEAMAAGRPAVTTNVGNCRELLEGDDDSFGAAGFCVPVMHQGELADAMLTLCQSETLRRQMGEIGRKRVQ
ncbi:MAG: glycosyltransferase, partial [Chloroflexia bacterium]|nr:glycosyltransferase [Chloroflexia bacterium]